MKKLPKPQKPTAPAPIGPKQLRTRHLSLLSGTREEWLKQIGDLPPGTHITAKFDSDSVRCQVCYEWQELDDSAPLLLYQTLETEDEFQTRLQQHRKVEEAYQQNLADYQKRLERWQDWRAQNAGKLAAAKLAEREKRIAALETEARKHKAALERVQARLDKATSVDNDEGSDND